MQTSHSYDGLNRLTQMGTAKNAVGISNYAYTLGAAGNRLTVAELSGRTVNYGYDSLYRLTSEAVTADPNDHNITNGYLYDAVGNRQQWLVNGVTVNAYTYDADDRLGTDAYDNDGNTINSLGTANSYDFENHLIQHGFVTVVYDGDGNRVAETVGGVTTNYLVDTQNPTGYAQVVDELVSGAVSRTYSYGLERISESQTLNSTWTPSFYGYDGHGSVRQLTDSTGAITDTYDYDAFGNLINSTGSTPNNYLFAGEQYDPALGLYYNRARYYNNSTGKFWSMDTLREVANDPGTLHRYLYVRANPVNGTDPTGMQDDLESLSIEEGAEETLDSMPTVQAGPAEDLASEAVQAENDALFNESMTWQEAQTDTLEEIGGQGQQPFNTSQGTRILDAYNPDTGVASEVKSGFVQYSERISTQIAKDAELLENGGAQGRTITQYVWRFYRSPYTGRIGADPRVLQELVQAGIKYVFVQ